MKQEIGNIVTTVAEQLLDSWTDAQNEYQNCGRGGNMNSTSNVLENEGANVCTLNMLPEVPHNDIRQEILQLRDTVERSYLRLSKLLFEVRHKGLYKDWGYPTFKDYCEKEIDFGFRKARYLTLIQEKLPEFTDSSTRQAVEDQFVEIGWYKASKIARIAKKENVQELITEAKQLSARQVDEKIRALINGKPERKTYPKNFVLCEDQAKTVDEALEMAQRLDKTYSPGCALSLICLEFMSNRIKESNELESLLMKLEERFHIFLIALDKESGNITYSRENAFETQGETELPLSTKSTLSGRTTQATDNNNETYDFVYKVVEIGDLITSDNSNYPSEYQPRDRDRIPSRGQIEKIARHLNPNRLLADNGDLTTGSPIIGSDSIVESGNGRVMALRESTLYPKYKIALFNRASDFGLKLNNIINMNKPILVRERTTPLTPAERITFTQRANVSSVAQLTSPELAGIDAQRLSDDIYNNFYQPEGKTAEESLRMGSNRAFVSKFFSLVSVEEMSKYVNLQGEINKEGIYRIVNALLVKTFGAGQVISNFIESSDIGIKNIGNGIMKSLGNLNKAQLRIETQEYDPNLSISNDILTVAKELQRMRDNGISLDEQYLNQEQLFERALNPLQEVLFIELLKRKNSAKAIASLFNYYAERINRMPVKDQVSAFPFPKVSKEEIFNEIKNLSSYPLLKAVQLPDPQNSDSISNLCQTCQKLGEESSSEQKVYQN
ncbi:MAG: hypothetical protein WC614_07570 [bacterium]